MGLDYEISHYVHPQKRSVIFHDRASRILEIEFDNGSVVQHTAVGEEIARRFIASSSPASVYKDTIQEEYTIRRIK